MVVEKRTLSIEELEAQTALELPERNLLKKFTLVYIDVDTGNIIDVDVFRSFNDLVDACVQAGGILTVLSANTFACRV